jgi:4-alpha-glucanotransferase
VTAAPLDRLARLAGVRASYRDAWGAERRVSREAIAAVLAAMGIDAGNETAIADAIAALEAEAWRTLLAPVVVMREDDGSALLTLPERLYSGRILWSVAGEERADGGADTASLAIRATKGEGEHRHLRLALPLKRLPPGYYSLNVAAGTENAAATLIVTPRRAYLPPELSTGRRAWGLTAQLYAVRSARNWGIGDFTDLGALSELAAAKGAQALGINPLHALFPTNPRHISPYSPSTRLYLNPLYLDVTACLDFAGAPEAQALEAARAGNLIDHEAVSALKRPVFARLYERFAAANLLPHGGARGERGAAFRRFQQQGGDRLRDYGRFNALAAHFARAPWPEPFRRADSDEVERFAAGHEAEVELHHYLEWECERQLGDAAARARRAGLGIGLYRDLAVGVDPRGAEAWADPALLCAGASIGAPPDQLNLKGQNWGLAPPNPVELRRRAYAPFIAALRANMRHAGVLRIDHAMALMQLYLVPRGVAPDRGAYVAYPFDDLLGLVALESVRNRCAVIGEDLGTVPQGFSARLNEANVLSYRLMLFERAHDGGFLRPGAYLRAAAATFSSHDLPTLKGFWLGRDLDWRQKLDLYPDADAALRDRTQRRVDRRRLLDALLAEGLLAPEAARRLLPTDDAPHFAPELAVAVHRFLGRTASALALTQVEDATGEEEQPNVPGTIDEHPNWRRRLSRTLEDLSRDPTFAELCAALDEERKKGG